MRSAWLYSVCKTCYKLVWCQFWKNKGPAVASCVTSKHCRQFFLFCFVLFFSGFASDRCSFLIFFSDKHRSAEKKNESGVSIWNGCQSFILHHSLSNEQTEGQDDADERQGYQHTHFRVWRYLCLKNYSVNEAVSHPVSRMARTSFPARKVSTHRFCFCFNSSIFWNRDKHSRNKVIDHTASKTHVNECWQRINILLSTLRALANHIFTLWEQRIIQTLWLCL